MPLTHCLSTLLLGCAFYTVFYIRLEWFLVMRIWLWRGIPISLPAATEAFCDLKVGRAWFKTASRMVMCNDYACSIVSQRLTKNVTRMNHARIDQNLNKLNRTFIINKGTSFFGYPTKPRHKGVGTAANSRSC